VPFFVAIIALALSLFAKSLVQGDVSLYHQYFGKKASQANAHITDLEASLQFSFEKEQYQFKSDFYGKKSALDQRSFFRIDEAYLDIDFEDDKFSIGKMIKFWGALEVYNIANIFNKADSRDDLFLDKRVGSWSVGWSHFYDASTLSLYAKLYEPSSKQASSSYPFAIANLEDDLQSSHSLFRPTLYLVYSGYSQDELAYDYAFILQNGYDNQRYILFDATQNRLKEYSYLVNKLTTYDTLVLEDTLYKLEASITDVIDEPMVSDYYQLGLGVEHTLVGFVGEADLGVLLEYYRYGRFDTKSLTPTQLGQNFDNDLFGGFRYSFNDIESSSLLVGFGIDLTNSDKAYLLEYETRLFDMLKLQVDFKDMRLPQRIQRFALKLSYHF
jgi:hypothetical protein